MAADIGNSLLVHDSFGLINDLLQNGTTRMTHDKMQIQCLMILHFILYYFHVCPYAFPAVHP